MKILILLSFSLLMSARIFAGLEEPFLVTSNDPHEMTILEHGADAFVERLKLIEKARYSIDVEYFIYNNDQAGRLLTQALMKRAREGVKVRMLLDAFSTKSVMTPAIVGLLSASGVEVKFYNPAPMIRIRKYMVRNHRKLLQIDQSVAILGGRNVADEYYDLNSEHSFVDRDILITGPITSHVQESFNRYWEHSFSEFAESKAGTQDKEALSFVTESSSDRKNLKSLREQAAIWRPNRATGTCHKVTFGTSKPGWGKESMSGEHLGNYLLQLLARARGKVLLDSAYFIVDSRLRSVLKSLVESGTRVDIITNSIHSHDVAVMNPATNISIRRLSRKGVNFWYFKGEKPEGYNLAPGFSPKKWATHIKSMIINDDTFMVGSYNFDPRAHHINGELALICEDSPELTAQVGGYFRKELDVSESVSSLKEFKEKRFNNVDALGKLKYFLAWPVSQMIRPLL